MSEQTETAMTADAGAAASADESLGVAGRLDRLAEEAAAEGETVTLGWILDSLNERAFGLFLLILSLPVCIPFLYGIPQVVAVPMLIVAAQMAWGRRSPWLPERLNARTVQTATLAQLAKRAGPSLRFFEWLSRPRLSFITLPPVDRIVGAFLFIFCVSVLIPLPATNTVPGIGVAIAAIGLLQRDGLITLLGVIVGAVWVAGLVYFSGWLIEQIGLWLGLI